MKGDIAIGDFRSIMLTGQDVQHHIPAGRSGRNRFSTGSSYSIKPIGRHGTENPDELPVAISVSAEQLPHQHKKGQKGQVYTGCCPNIFAFSRRQPYGLDERLNERSDSHMAENNGGQIVAFSDICMKDNIGTVQFFIFCACA